MSNKSLYNKFPNQLVTVRSEKWYKECIDAAIDFITLDYHGIRRSFQNKLRNYNLANDIFDFDSLKKQLVPLYAQDSKYPIEIQHYPLAMQKIDLLVGEEARRKFNWTVRVTNDDAITLKEEAIDKELDDFFIEQLQNHAQSEEELAALIKEKKAYINTSFQDKRERMANQLLTYYWHHLDLKELFLKGFQDLLIVGEEIYRVDILGNEPIIERVNPLTVHVVGGNNSPFVEDAEIIIQDEYWSPSAIIDAYYDELTEAQVKKIENHLYGGKSKADGSSVPGFDATPEYIMVDTTLENFDLVHGSLLNHSRINDNGEIRVSRVVWKGKRRVGFLTYIDEFGEIQQKVVSDKYEMNESAGDLELNFKWINEGLEGTRIGGDNDNIYIKMRPLAIQNRQIDNPSKCSLGYVGVYANVNNNKAMSMVDRLYQYQLMYNLYMNKLNFLFVKYKGPIYELDFSKMPDKYEPEEWMYYAEVLGWELSDPFNEGRKGAAMGKLAGNLQQTRGVKEANLYSIIQQTIDMLMYIEQQAGSVSGITKAREGQIQQREAVSNVTREITQSAHITEKWFLLHDQVKRKVLELFLETAKYAFRNGKNKKAQYVMDDSTIQMLDIDGGTLNEATYGVHVMDSSNIQELFMSLKELSHAALQNDKATLSQVASIYTDNSIASVINKIETAEKEAEERITAQRDHEERLLQMQMQQAQLDKQEDNELKLLMQAREIQKDIMIAFAELAQKAELSQNELEMKEKLTLLEEENMLFIEKLKASVEEKKIKAIGKKKTEA